MPSEKTWRKPGASAVIRDIVGVDSLLVGVEMDCFNRGFERERERREREKESLVDGGLIMGFELHGGNGTRVGFNFNIVFFKNEM